MDVVLNILTIPIKIVTTLGWANTFFLAVGIGLLILAVKLFDMLDRVVERLERRWKRWQPTTRWAIVVIVGAVAWSGGLFGALWDAFPKSTGAVVVVVAGTLGLWWQGVRFADRYDLTNTTARAAWLHHLQVSRLARRGTAAISDATGKKGGRARKPRLADDGIEFPVEPPDGMSAGEAADFFNDGHANSALARRVGWDAVRDTTAVVASDGTVTVKVHPDVAHDDFFAESKPWPGMEPT